MINTLYIHGLDSSPNNAKMIAIGEYGGVKGLHLNYRKQADAFQLLDKAIIENEITHIVGSSMGGYLGFYLAHKHQLPCLLFNPALTERSVQLEVEKVDNECPERIIVLGIKDEIVNPNDTMRFLEKTEFIATKHELILNQTLEHQIPLDVFRKAVQYFLG